MFERHFLRGAMLASGLALLVALRLPMLALADKDPPVDVLRSEWHDASRLHLAIDDNGGWGSGGLETRWPCPGDCVDHTFRACLLAGNGADALADGYWGREWETSAGGAVKITEPGVFSDEYGCAQYEDTGYNHEYTGYNREEAAGQQHLLGLRVTQHSCAWEGTDFVLVSYVFRNVSGYPLSGLYIGHYADLDVAFTPSGDITNYSASQSLAYNCDRDEPYCLGLRYFTREISSYNNRGCCVEGDANVFALLSNGQIDSRYPPTGTWDVEFITGVGPFDLAPDEEFVLGTAWVAGDSVGDLKANANQALAAWEASNGCGTVEEVEAAEEFVPEPGSILLLASGFLGLAGYAGLRKWRR
jgi:hypothetical protein